MKTFTVLEDHLKLLRRAIVSFDDMEFGAPAINPKRPYGNSDAVGDIAEILGVPVPDDEEHVDSWVEANEGWMRALHVETATVLEIVLRTGEFRAGQYVASDYGSDWRRA